MVKHIFGKTSVQVCGSCPLWCWFWYCQQDLQTRGSLSLWERAQRTTSPWIEDFSPGKQSHSLDRNSHVLLGDVPQCSWSAPSQIWNASLRTVLIIRLWGSWSGPGWGLQAPEWFLAKARQFPLQPWFCQCWTWNTEGAMPLCSVCKTFCTLLWLLRVGISKRTTTWVLQHFSQCLQASFQDPFGFPQYRASLAMHCLYQAEDWIQKSPIPRKEERPPTNVRFPPAIPILLGA